MSLAELEERYDAVVYAVGASADRPLGIAGEGLPGSLSATDVVGWYNGHPDKQDLAVDLDTERAVVIGNGNVALDVARILTADPAALARTDIADPALAALSHSSVREVVVLGRRGPAEAAFTVPELVGLGGLVERGLVNVAVEGVDDLLAEGLHDQRSRLVRDLSSRPPTSGVRTIVLRFLAAPVRLVGGEHVTGLEVARTRLERGADGGVVAVPTGESEVVQAGLVLRAVGYRGLPVTDLPYDEVSGTVPNDRGRVRPGLYVAGWVKRGPTGFIGSNKACAQETVQRILDDLDAAAARRPRAAPSSIETLVAGRCPHAFGLAGWRALDAEERRRGRPDGRPRAKLVDVDEMFRVVAGAAPTDARATSTVVGGVGPGVNGGSPRRRGYPSVKRLGWGQAVRR